MSEKNICFRLAQQNDCRMLWEWSNHSSIRQASFSVAQIDWDSHVHWFNRKIINPDCYYWVAVDGYNKPIGQVRFELNQATTEEAVISVSVAPKYQGHGYGQPLIKSASRKLLMQTPVEHITAFIKIKNIRSIRTFEKAGFHKIGKKIIKGQQSFVYIKSKF